MKNKIQVTKQEFKLIENTCLEINNSILNDISTFNRINITNSEFYIEIALSHSFQYIEISIIHQNDSSLEFSQRYPTSVDLLEILLESFIKKKS